MQHHRLLVDPLVIMLLLLLLFIVDDLKATNTDPACRQVQSETYPICSAATESTTNQCVKDEEFYICLMAAVCKKCTPEAAKSFDDDFRPGIAQELVTKCPGFKPRVNFEKHDCADVVSKWHSPTNWDLWIYLGGGAVAFIILGLTVGFIIVFIVRKSGRHVPSSPSPKSTSRSGDADLVKVPCVSMLKMAVFSKATGPSKVNSTGGGKLSKTDGKSKTTTGKSGV